MRFCIGFIIVVALLIGACGGNSGSVSEEERREVLVEALLVKQTALTREQAECVIDRFIDHGIDSREQLNNLADDEALELGIEMVARCDIPLFDLD